MVKTIAFICLVWVLAIPLEVASFKAQKFPQSFYVEGLDITISEKDLGAMGPYPLIGAHFIIKKGNTAILNKTVEVDGYLHGAWVTDLDRDRQPEITLWVRTHGSGGYGSFSLFELEKGELSKHNFPPLSKNQKKGYMGHDQFTTSPSNIIRRYQTYKDSDPNCCPTGDTVELIYGYQKDQIVLQRYRRLD